MINYPVVVKNLEKVVYKAFPVLNTSIGGVSIGIAFFGLISIGTLSIIINRILQAKNNEIAVGKAIFDIALQVGITITFLMVF
jgi:hypothetical protein